MIVAREFQFDAAHHLPRHPGRCRNLHGHTYRVQVVCEGPVDPDSGMVVDFAEIRRVVEERVLSRVDHANLNDVLENPTAEWIARWIWHQLDGQGLPLKEIRLFETPTCFVVYAGEDGTAP